MIKKDGQYISKLERGVFPGVTVRVLEQLADALGCTTDYLLGRGKEAAAADDDDPERLAPWRAAMLAVG